MEFIFELFAQLLRQDNTDQATDDSALMLNNNVDAVETDSEEFSIKDSSPVNIFSVVNFH